MFSSPDDSAQVSLDRLVKLAQVGDEQAFTSLFTYYNPGLRRYLAGLIQHTEESDELVQEAFLRAWKELPRLQQIARFKSWLYRIATNLAHDHRRHQKTFKWSSLDEGDELESPIRFEEQVAEDEIVKMALKVVPWKYRTCLLLKIEGRLSHDEIAEAVNINPKSVSTYISFGRQHFRQEYKRLQQEQMTARERKSVQ